MLSDKLFNNLNCLIFLDMGKFWGILGVSYIGSIGAKWLAKANMPSLA